MNFKNQSRLFMQTFLVQWKESSESVGVLRLIQSSVGALKHDAVGDKKANRDLSDFSSLTHKRALRGIQVLEDFHSGANAEKR